MAKTTIFRCKRSLCTPKGTPESRVNPSQYIEYTDLHYGFFPASLSYLPRIKSEWRLKNQQLTLLRSGLVLTVPFLCVDFHHFPLYIGIQFFINILTRL